MFRRRFLQLATLSSAASLGTLEIVQAATASKSVTYRVTGFSCPTCAVGLDTMLGRQKGILSSKSTYPEGKVTVRFHPNEIAESAIKAFIADMGFTAEAEPGA